MSKATELAGVIEQGNYTHDDAQKAAAELRRLDALIEACEPYLKDGETPVERIEREREDTAAMTRLYGREKEKTEALLRSEEHTSELQSH